MWVCTTRGFVSIVEDSRSREERLVVRAREKEILVHLVSLLPGDREILEDDGKDRRKPRRDYRWRIFATHDEMAAVMAELVAGIDYSNFKNEVGSQLRRGFVSKAYEHALHDVWDVFGKIQKGGPYGWHEKSKPRRRGKRQQVLPVDEFPYLGPLPMDDGDREFGDDPLDPRFLAEVDRG